MTAGVEDSIRHRALQLYMEAGRRHGQAHGADTVDEIKRVLRECRPAHGDHFPGAGAKHRDLGELEAAGVAAVTFPSVALFAAPGGASRHGGAHARPFARGRGRSAHAAAAIIPVDRAQGAARPRGGYDRPRPRW